MYVVFQNDLRVDDRVRAAYKSLFKPTDFVYINKQNFINEAIKKYENQIKELKLKIDSIQNKINSLKKINNI